MALQQPPLKRNPVTKVPEKNQQRRLSFKENEIRINRIFFKKKKKKKKRKIDRKKIEQMHKCSCYSKTVL